MYTAPAAAPGSKSWYLPLLILLSGLGGLVAGVDYGIIAVALLYLDKTIPMTPAEQGFMVSIYVFGGVIASLVAGAMADFIGRRKMIITAGAMFVASILLIYVANGYVPLLVGRVLMGLSGGFVCVVIPLYMAECLPTEFRGRGTAAFQFLMTVGFLLSSIVGTYFAGIHDKAVEAAAGDPALIFAADEAAWRNIFLTAAVPGVLFIVAAALVKESPRWLFRRKRTGEAADILRLSRSAEQAELEMKEMTERSAESTTKEAGAPAHADSLLQRKYVVPFVIACVVLACTQATGINSIMSYGAKILQGAGLSEADAAKNLQIVTGINVGVTLLGALLVDKLGRKILLTVGTGGIVACLLSAGVIFNNFESKRVDVLAQVQPGLAADGKTLVVKVDADTLGKLEGDAPGQLTVAYKFEKNSKPAVATAFSNAADDSARVLKIEQPAEKKWETDAAGKKVEVVRVTDAGKIELLKASYGPIADASTGKWITGLLCAFIGFFAIGPGVCVWLALTELMPTRIRSVGMSVAMVLNTGVQFLSALFFPIVVGSQGFHVMFFIWGGCTVLYFITAAFFMPETKGKTLEEIEDHFAGKKHA